MRIFRGFFALLAALAVPAALSAQNSEQSDSLVRLISAESLQQVEIRGVSYRKAFGTPESQATFLHNNTYLICDTAYWNMNTRVIDAFGHVKLLQDETVLTSDKLVYYIDKDLAEFRGSLVQLMDKDHNTLRTRHLDYNTKDSVAVFENGGAMRDKDGQIIESDKGDYDSKIKLFKFRGKVNMFTDSIFVKTKTLEYESERNFATFGRDTHAWKDDKMLSSQAGWYDRNEEKFLFYNEVHLMTTEKEGWSDSLYFWRPTQNVLMLGHAQVTDTTRRVNALAGRMDYVDSLKKVTMTIEPAAVCEIDDKERESGKDTLYIGAETLVYKQVRMCDIDSLFLVNAKKRLSDLNIDPVSEYRKKAAKAAAEAAKAAQQDDPNNKEAAAAKRAAAAKAAEEKPADDAGARSSRTPGDREPGAKKGRDRKKAKNSPADSLAALPIDTLAADSLAIAIATDSLTADTLATDTLAMAPAVDSLMADLPADTLATDSLAFASAADSLAAGLADSTALVEPEPKDTTLYGFATALRNVKLYRNKMQIVCDSLQYSDIDSLARLFKEPLIWNEVTHQYAADSIYIVVKDGKMEKANLMSEAFIHMQEDTTHYNQIRGSEMVAYFGEDNEMTRFDALGGASAIFYIEENKTLATVNKKESKMLSGVFKDGEIDRIYYYDTAESDTYPVVQLKKEEQTLKGFNWQPEKRPEDRYAVTPYDLRSSQRKRFSREPRAYFRQTEQYFPGYMEEIYVQIARRDSLQKVHEARERMLSDSLEHAALLDSLAMLDSLALAPSDSLSRPDFEAVSPESSVSDTTGVSAPNLEEESDETKSEEPAELSVKEQKAQDRELAKALRMARAKAKQSERERKWAEKDKKDLEKLELKKAKELEKARKKALKAARLQAEQDAKDERRLQKYKEKLAAQLEAKSHKDAAKAAKKAAKDGGMEQSQSINQQ